MEKLIHVVRTFKSTYPMHEAQVTLGGTGVNGAKHFDVLHELGGETVWSLSKLTILSGSVFSYILYLASQNDIPLNIEYFKKFDSNNRQYHRSSFFKSCQHLLTQGLKQGLHPNYKLGDACLSLLPDQFLDKTLGELPSNVYFYSYCHKRDQLIELHSKSYFATMNLREVLRASATVTPLHGFFEFEDYQLSDPLFSPRFSELRKEVLKPEVPHLYVNFKKQGMSKNVMFARDNQSWHPMYPLLRDFLLFYFDLPNPAINQTHRKVLQEWESEAYSMSTGIA